MKGARELTEIARREAERPDAMEISAAHGNGERQVIARVIGECEPGFLPAAVFAAALLAFCAGSVPVGFAQEHDHEHDHATPIQPTAAGPGNPELEAAVYEELAGPVVEAYREEFRTAANPNALRTPLRAMIGDIHETVAARLVDDVANRVTVARAVREKFLASIEEIASTPATRGVLHDLFEAALEADRSSRREHLWSVLMCWCPREKWTRTLAGCPDACADEQKSMISTWVAEGRTSDEVVELMVAQPQGGEKVRGYLKATGINRLGYLLPFLFFGAAAVVFGVVLRRVTRKRDESFVPPSDGGDRPDGDRSDGGRSDEPSEEDKHWSDLVEKELKEMDN